MSAFGSAAFASQAFASNAFRPTIESTTSAEPTPPQHGGYYPIDDVESQRIEMMRQRGIELEEIIIMMITKGLI